MAVGRVQLVYLLILWLGLNAVESRRNDNQVWPTTRFYERDSRMSSVTDKDMILRYLKLTLEAMEKGLAYLNNNVDNVNLDCIIGPRSTESKVSFIVSKYWPLLPPDISRRMKDIVVEADKFSTAAEAHVKKATPKYYSVSYPLIRPHFNDFFFPPRMINASLVEMFTKRTEPFSEETSDRCLLEFYGNTQKRCQISDKCWNIMTAPKQRYYSLTHEVFYLVNGIQSNCLQELKEIAYRKSGKSVVYMLDFFCSNVYKEALHIERGGFKPGLRDLFMEQIGLCGDAGYVEMARWSWLEKILSWQRENGCYGLFENETLDERNFDPNMYGKSKRSAPSILRRTKRSEQLISSDGCLSHRIGVAFSALNTYIRRLVGEYVGETI